MVGKCTVRCVVVWFGRILYMYSIVKQLCQCAVYGKRGLAKYYYLFVELNSVRVVAGLCEVTQ